VALACIPDFHPAKRKIKRESMLRIGRRDMHVLETTQRRNTLASTLLSRKRIKLQKIIGN